MILEITTTKLTISKNMTLKAQDFLDTSFEKLQSRHTETGHREVRSVMKNCLIVTCSPASMTRIDHLFEMSQAIDRNAR